MKWQLLIFDAVVRSTLLYGLETIHLTDAMLKKIDAFQLRCLRKILKVPSTSIDRRNTNTEVLNRHTALAYPNRGDRREFELFSQSYLCRNSKSLGHAGLATTILCAKFPALFYTQSFLWEKTSRSPETKLVALRQKHTFEHILGGYDYTETVAEDSRIYNAAFTRTF